MTQDSSILALLALAGEPIGRARIADMLSGAGLLPGLDELGGQLDALRTRGAVTDVIGRGYAISPAHAWPALAEVLQDGRFERLRAAYEGANPLRRNWDGFVVLRSYRQGVAMLRMALMAGDEPKKIVPLLQACMACHEAAYLHPLVDALARPFEPAQFARIHPLLQDEILAVLLDHSQRDPASAPAVRAFAEQHLAAGSPSLKLRATLVEHLILCARLDDAAGLLDSLDPSAGLFYGSTISLLRGALGEALDGYAAALKAIRKETGKRKAVFSGICGHLYVLALLRSSDPVHGRDVDAYLDIVTRAVQNFDTPAYQQLSMLRQIRAGTVETGVFASRNWETALQATMFRALLHDWLGLPQLVQKRPLLEQQFALARQAGFDLIAAQLGAVLGRLGAVTFEQEAVALRQAHRIDDMTLWFEREESWERQLNALINLQPAVNTPVVRETRLAWLLQYDPHYGITEIEPREQKRDAQGGWGRGRALALRRLLDDAEALDFLTAQDLAVVAAIRGQRSAARGGIRLEFDLGKAVAALVGHPLLFWLDAPGSRIELLPGEPELVVKARLGQVSITLLPPPRDGMGDVVLRQETPGRLRVVQITDEYRRIGAIVGDGLTVPLQAEKQVLKAISAISTMVTVQSDIGGSADDIVQVAADRRLHVHLLPYQQGLRMQVLVRPLPGAGAYYSPGCGAASVIADVDGARTEAKRDLDGERTSLRELVAACPALEETEHEHGEWLAGQPLVCLELLDQLQSLDPAAVTIAWPEGEPFRVTRQASSKSMRLSIKRDKDWFAVDGTLDIDEGKVLDLRALLDAVREGHGRFVALGDNQFLALSNELHRRLMEMAAFGTESAKGLRVHPLASFALEDLAGTAASIQADKAWREHIARMRASEAFQPQLPSTLQAELRDYQREGYEWLARLAHWGVGACLADDMGLGKTLQALALLVARAADGPALVVAPTSVCLNWASEAARFAPTLNIRMFGPGDRHATIADAGPFDLVIASYGLLQLEAGLFAPKQWHSIVLDEAQAIKNMHTKRSQAVMALQGSFRMVATGTPLENHLGELWNLFRFINPGLLGTSDQFNLRFAGPIERNQDKRAAAGARARLKRLIAPFILRRTKAQVLQELPARTEIVLPVELTQEEAALYETLRREALERIATLEAPEAQKSIAILAEMMRLRRACCNPALVAPELGLQSGKLTVFARLLEGLLENRHKVLVFSQFVDHLALIRAHLDKQGVRYQYLDGSTPMAERQRRVDAFQAGEGDVFLISLKAGGVGINLTAADYVIHMDPWWNPAVEDQASDRAHRMGQQRPVTIYRLVARNTIEEGIVDLHKHKRDLADSLLEGSDAAARMSSADMLKMLQDGLQKH
jgi:superfamily II DNA or RNA helicase